MNRNSLLYTVLFSFAITFVLVLPLAIANELTKPIVEANKARSKAQGILEALDMYVAGMSPDSIMSAYRSLELFTADASGNLVPLSWKDMDAASKTGQSTGPVFYRGTVGEKVHIAGTFAGPGLWGTITLAMGFSQDMERIAGFKVLDQAETPGLGSRIAEPWFVNQFKGQFIPPDGQLIWKTGDGSGSRDKDDAVLDAVTGATLTTNGVKDIVAKAVLDMRRLFGGGKP